ncbi:hypothetical protein GCM10009745_51070 [Kribbella yunnanensis]|uniref:DUF3592 domain-containing protein n=1 Tax=Kribbella yunnanensis TaxID=190194 RepID=A0ABP4U388_9ACTN
MVVLLGAAILCGSIGWTLVSDVYWLRQRGEVVTATVVAVDHPRAGKPPRWIDVRYVTRAGEAIDQRVSRFSHYKAIPRQIDVIYDRDQPHRVSTVDRGLDYTFHLVLFTIITAGLLAAAVVLLLWKHPQPQVS